MVIWGPVKSWAFRLLCKTRLDWRIPPPYLLPPPPPPLPGPTLNIFADGEKMETVLQIYTHTLSIFKSLSIQISLSLSLPPSSVGNTFAPTSAPLVKTQPDIQPKTSTGSSDIFCVCFRRSKTNTTTNPCHEGPSCWLSFCLTHCCLVLNAQAVCLGVCGGRTGGGKPGRPGLAAVHIHTGIYTYWHLTF